MRGKTGTLGQSCLLLLAIACFITPAHTQQTSTEIAQSLQRGAQTLGREALWTAAAASTFIPGQGALLEAAQSALHSGTEAARSLGAAPLADAVLAGESSFNSTLGGFRSATLNLTSAAIVGAAPWAAPIAQVALNHASALGDSVQTLAGVPSSGLSLRDEEEEAVIRELAQAPVEEASFAGKPLGYRDEDEDAGSLASGESQDVADFFARQVASRGISSDMPTFAPHPALAPTPLSSARQSRTSALARGAEGQLTHEGGRNRVEGVQDAASIQPGAPPDPSYYVAAGQALAAAIFGSGQEGVSGMTEPIEASSPTGTRDQQPGQSEENTGHPTLSLVNPDVTSGRGEDPDQASSVGLPPPGLPREELLPEAGAPSHTTTMARAPHAGSPAHTTTMAHAPHAGTPAHSTAMAHARHASAPAHTTTMTRAPHAGAPPVTRSMAPAPEVEAPVFTPSMAPASVVEAPAFTPSTAPASEVDAPGYPTSPAPAPEVDAPGHPTVAAPAPVADAADADAPAYTTITAAASDTDASDTQANFRRSESEDHLSADIIMRALGPRGQQAASPASAFYAGVPSPKISDSEGASLAEASAAAPAAVRGTPFASNELQPGGMSLGVPAGRKTEMWDPPSRPFALTDFEDAPAPAPAPSPMEMSPSEADDLTEADTKAAAENPQDDSAQVGIVGDGPIAAKQDLEEGAAPAPAPVPEMAHLLATPASGPNAASVNVHSPTPIKTAPSPSRRPAMLAAVPSESAAHPIVQTDASTSESAMPPYAGKPIAQAVADMSESAGAPASAGTGSSPILRLGQLRDLTEKQLADIYRQGVADVPGNIPAEKNKFAYCDDNEVLTNSFSRPRGWPAATAIPGYDELANNLSDFFKVGKVFYTDPASHEVSLWNLVLTDRTVGTVDKLGTVAVRENGDEDGRPAIHVDHSGADSLLAEGTDDEFRRVGPSIWLGHSTVALNLSMNLPADTSRTLPRPLLSALQSVRAAAARAGQYATSQLEEVVPISFYYAINCQSYYIPKLRYISGALQNPSTHSGNGSSDPNAPGARSSLAESQHEDQHHSEPFVLWPTRETKAKHHHKHHFKSVPAAAFAQIFNASWVMSAIHSHT